MPAAIQRQLFSRFPYSLERCARINRDTVRFSGDHLIWEAGRGIFVLYHQLNTKAHNPLDPRVVYTSKWVAFWSFYPGVVHPFFDISCIFLTTIYKWLEYIYRFLSLECFLGYFSRLNFLHHWLPPTRLEWKLPWFDGSDWTFLNYTGDRESWKRDKREGEAVVIGRAKDRKPFVIPRASWFQAFQLYNIRWPLFPLTTHHPPPPYTYKGPVPQRKNTSSIFKLDPSRCRDENINKNIA